MQSNWREDTPVYLAGAAAVMAVVSIAAFEILLGVAFASLLLTGRLRRPPLLWPVLAWMGWTLVALAASGHLRGGIPQVKKLYVFLMLAVVYSAIRTLPQVRVIVMSWGAAAALSATWGLVQFGRKYHAAQVAHEDFYRDYVAARITGFSDHWMTFSLLMMMALLLIGALILFSQRILGASAGCWPQGSWWAPGWSRPRRAACGEPRRRARSTCCGFSKRWLVLAVPVLAANSFPNQSLRTSRAHDFHRSSARRLGFERAPSGAADESAGR